MNERPVPFVPAAPSVGHALLIVLALTVNTFLTMVALSQLDGDVGTHPAHWLALAGHAAIVVAIVFFAALRPARMTFADLGWVAFNPARDLPWAVAALLLAAAFPIAVHFLDGGDAPGLIDAIRDGSLPTRFAYCGIGFAAAFAEESIFRGFLLPALEKKTGNKVAAFAIMCLVFSLYHLPRHPLAFVGRILTGFAYGLAAKRTGALWAGAIAHFLTWAILGAM